jgi:hypothetical protein
MLMCCVCKFSLHRESPDMILGDEPLISKVVLSQSFPLKVKLQIGTQGFHHDAYIPGSSSKGSFC